MKSSNLTKILLSTFIVIFAGATFVSCNDDDKNECKVCGTTSPLTKLEWLKDIVSELDTTSTKAEILTCKYQNNTDGFLISECIDCPDFGYTLMNCQGDTIGVVWGFAGHNLDTFGIDSSSCKLIFSNHSKQIIK